MSFSRTLMMFAGLALMMSETNPRTPNHIFEKPEPPKTPAFITKAGNGKTKFIFDTEYCVISIFADNLKSANKKLKPILIENAIQANRMVRLGMLAKIKNLE